VGKEVGFPRQPGCWLRSSHTFKECVIAHWSRNPAPKINGAKTCHRSYGFCMNGRGAYCTGRRISGSESGQYSRENAGISNESKARNLTVESLRVPGEG
jgi:hypothetical protein